MAGGAGEGGVAARADACLVVGDLLDGGAGDGEEGAEEAGDVGGVEGGAVGVLPGAWGVLEASLTNGGREVDRRSI